MGSNKQNEFHQEASAHMRLQSKDPGFSGQQQCHGSCYNYNTISLLFSLASDKLRMFVAFQDNNILKIHQHITRESQLNFLDQPISVLCILYTWLNFGRFWSDRTLADIYSSNVLARVM